jgi:parvulin-like peptidyl-prolyl isomerase
MSVPRLLTAVVLSILFLAGCVLPSFAQDKILAIVNSDIITQRDLDDFINFTRIQLSGEYSGEKLEDKIRSMKSDMLEKLIEDRLILQEAQKNNIKVDDSRVKAKIAEVKKRYGTEEEFQQALMEQGLVEADLQTRIKEQLLMYNIVDAKIRKKIVVKPSEITDYYAQNQWRFNKLEERDFQSLILEDEAKANSIYEQLKSGKDVIEAGKENSLTVNTFSVKRGELKEDIEDILFNMISGELTQPMKINGKFYIFKLNNVSLSRQQTLLEVQDAIAGILLESKMQEEMVKWLDGIKKTAYIKIN